MAFDGIFIKALVSELEAELLGERVKKIYQPEKDEIRLVFSNSTLLISANPSNARVHLTETKKENPSTPPTFCMSLRKNLLNAKLVEISQLNSDRVLILTFEKIDEYGVNSKKNLICEITGKNSNIILTEQKGDSQTIIDAIRRIGTSKSHYRQILPGLDYKNPPLDGRVNLFDYERSELAAAMQTSRKTPVKFLTDYFVGLSPKTVEEVCYRSRVDADLGLNEISEGEKQRLINALDHLLKSNEKIPALFYTKQRYLDFSVIDLTNLNAQKKEIATVSELLERYFKDRDNQNHFKNKSASVRSDISQKRKSLSKKLQNLFQDLKKTENNEKNRLYGDLITANIYQIKKGDKEIEVLNFYEEEPQYVKIPLKVNETPAQNAQRFYKKYTKNKRAVKELNEQIEKTKKQIEHCEALLNSLETSTEVSELNEIIYEYKTSDLSKKRKTKLKKPEKSKPYEYESSEGFKIIVGKNNLQNEYIATRLGKDDDCWLHVKDAPGSHVLIVSEGKFIPETTVLEAGKLAAYYSKMKNSSNVAVDYLEFKDLKKPKNSRPGFVTYTNQNTMYVTPYQSEIESLKKRS